MTQKIRLISTFTALLFLAAGSPRSLPVRATGENDRLLFQKFRMTRPELIKAREQLKKNSLDKAEQTLLKVLKQMPENADASYYLAETVLPEGRIRKRPGGDRRGRKAVFR